ncbi:MAG: ABC transporter permease subunit [Syntrophomonadaceae bacterium]|nr:ABC transporter permease subunit [Syntrophomonadaceae bacterium]MDD3024199.1 ABC transporter permease subunit [Syntrophomonadaceae bacterium]
MKTLVLNPILGKEYRSRMRSWKSPLIISLYLGILGIITLGYYWVKQKNIFYTGFGPDVGPQIYVMLTYFQLMLISFVTPALTAGAINGEKERQTFDLLLCTRLSAVSIVINKLLASLGYIILLIIASLPVFGIVYFFGGVLLSDIGRVFIVYLVTAITFGVIGIFCSTLFKRTQISMVVSYLIVLFLLVGTIILAAFLQGIQSQPYQTSSAAFISYLNPLVALASIFPNQGQNLVNIFDFLRLGVATPGNLNQTLSPWAYNFIINGVIVIFLLLISIIRLDPVGRFSWLRKSANKDHKNAEQDQANDSGLMKGNINEDESSS